MDLEHYAEYLLCTELQLKKDKNDMADKIIVWRKENSLNQKEMAKKMGISPTYMGEIENKKKLVTTNLLNTLYNNLANN